tara:strand:- start:1080 stop:1337 length:258 start_codon:yes stop_codon:yes gene_type:complete
MVAPPKYLGLVKDGELVVNGNGNILVLEDRGHKMDRRDELMIAYNIQEHPHDYMLGVYDSFDTIPRPDGGDVVDLEGTLDWDGKI